MGDPMPFETQAPQSQRWTDAASDALEAGTLSAALQRIEGILVSKVTGNCPRCNDIIDDRQVLTAVGEGIKAVAAKTGDNDFVSVTVTCTCAEHHPTPPPKTRGCGISFRLELRRPK